MRRLTEDGLERRTTAAKYLLTPLEVLALVALVLGFSRDGGGLYEPARALLLPGGVAFVIRGLLITSNFFDPPLPRGERRTALTRRTHQRLATTLAGLGIAAAGLACCGVALEHLGGGDVGRALVIPGGLAVVAFGLLLVVRPEAVEPERSGGVRKRLIGAFAVVMGIFAIGWGLGYSL